ncbi:putative GTP-binding protein [Neospora caninum Liverpool]|uniref:GTP-binding protein, putative n=1 Tax=Neospora caninum (strain Liverpool) TaxID=572307 RepID=F0VQ30_NEOCL|nr:putative GTP-binding protein [Neospora caninum Liverpool]CBZ55827.1 putative GTP-binding protein [Neospora caninum Liverpool]CEL70569.1 TPA: GTP-binding protein, putative [Neospora caninum Liverpool]|eukprot:XP_003885853.1 putative GTP-binding protein [Neospora caninum Liverpool]
MGVAVSRRLDTQNVAKTRNALAEVPASLPSPAHFRSLSLSSFPFSVSRLALGLPASTRTAPAVHVSSPSSNSVPLSSSCRSSFASAASACRLRGVCAPASLLPCDSFASAWGRPSGSPPLETGHRLPDLSLPPAWPRQTPRERLRAAEGWTFAATQTARSLSTGRGRRSSRAPRRRAEGQAEACGGEDAEETGDVQDALAASRIPATHLQAPERRVQRWREEQDAEPVPLLARPFVHAFQPREFLNRDDLPWLTSEQKKYSRILFGKPIAAHPVLVAQTLHKLPHNPWPQVAAVGHSNVGKSSLLNALMHGRDVARSCSIPLPNGKVLTLPKVAPVSHAPGRTRHLFTFDLGNHLSLVDLPGYGFARVKPQLKEEWAILIEEYFTRSKHTKGVEPLDEKLWQLLAEKDLPFQVVLTKVDLLSAPQLHEAMFNVLTRLQTVEKKETLLHPFVHAVSSRYNHGIPELRASLSAIASDWRKRHNLGLFKFQGREDSPVRRHR